ncbi:PIG-L deacetylase family protein [Clostridium drakei]|uniref:GlcNAc-PI de-N-acetylase n=1 Tax=Clostridium drakei TaxID=332101 RepID=A0A2U8DLV7_9CLOT|nr:PIG-L family deacetylase [Clostridium drakei]AWI03686.1 GlcNAc-PI de-N-acetylase [Clostridium drakei]
MNKKILVVAAHPDDELLGVGATIVHHIKSNDKCFALILGEGITSRYGKRDLADVSNIEDLHKDTLKAAKVIGYEKVYFENFPDNRFDSIDLLDVVKIVEKYIEEVKPDIIYTHHSGDLNVDHRKTYEAVLTASRPIESYCVKEIYSFETVSSSEWNFEYINSFKPNYFVDVTFTLDKKLNSVSFYKSEMRNFPHPRSIENLEVTAKKWGSVIGTKYAEAFEVVRIIK